MTTLAADMTATQGYIPQTDVSPGFYTLGSELIRVSSERTADRSERGGGQFDSMGTVVSRGIAGTSAAAHSAGVSFTSIQDPSTGGGSGGVSVPDPSAAPDGQVPTTASGAYTLVSAAGLQTVTLLGPFPFAYNSPNIASQYRLTDLDAGTVVVRAWVEVTTPFSGSPGAFLQIGVGGPDWDDPDSDWGAVSQCAATAVSGTVNGVEFENSTIDPSLPRIARLTQAGALVVYLGSDSYVAGAGVGYAIVATPAS